MAKETLHMLLDEKLYKALKAEAELTNKSMAKIVSELIADVLVDKEGVEV